MKFANIIIIGIILVIIYIVLTRTILKTNIVYDKILDANDDTADVTTASNNEVSFISINSVRKNLIPNDVLNDNLSSNLMISVWFYIDNWEVDNNIEKNILFVGNSETNTTVGDLRDPVMTGVSHRKCVTADAATGQTPAHKSLALSLGQYDNDLFIDIKTLKPASEAASCTGDYYTRFKIENIPIQKWNCLTISIDTLLLDVYLDGRLYSSFILPGVYDPEIGNGSGNNHIYLGNLSPLSTVTGFNQGFVGFITRVRFEPNAINTQDAMNIYKAGINKSLLNSLFNKYSLKVSFLEYNKEKGSFSI